MTYIERNVRLESGGAFPENFSMPHTFQQSYYTDDDAMEQLENARVNRSGYYRRMEKSRGSPLLLQELSSLGDSEISNTVVVKEKGISEGGPSDASLPRVPEPHPSWRFYTSYDNGEWKRHMVPVYHSEKDVLNTSPGIGARSPLKSESDFSFESPTPTYAIESNIRRMRLGRPSVYECLQNRRQRVSGEHRRVQAPRSAETILNSVEYLPFEEMKKRYNFDNYSPRRRTEYGERVIYPRVNTESSSSGDSGFKKLSANVSEGDEVTRSVHPSCLQVDSTSSFETSKAEGRPPSQDDNSGERIIIPTKYKQANHPATKPARSILDIADESRTHLSSHKDRTIRRRTPSPSPRLSNISTHYITSDDSHLSLRQPQPRSRSRDAGYHGVNKFQDRDREIKVLLVNPSVNHNQHVTTVSTGFSAHNGTNDGADFNEVRPSVRYNNHDVAVQNQHISQQNQIQNYQNQQQPFQPQQQQSFTQSDYTNQTNQHTARPSSSRSSELAARVKANTMATVQQMQERMMSDMKNTCPQAAETVDSLLSGKVVDGVSVQSRQLTLEQENMWQAGKPVEGKITREARVFTNDAVSGPQDFVERSSISQDLSDIPTAGTFIQHPFLQMNTSSNASGGSMALERSDQNRYPSVFSTPQPSFNEKSTGLIKGPTPRSGHSSRQQQQQQEYVSRSPQKYTENSNYGSSAARSNDFIYAPENPEIAGFKEKIIIPTKYKGKTTSSKNEMSNVASRSTVGSVGGAEEISRSYKFVTSPGSSDTSDGVFQGSERFRTVNTPASYDQADASTSSSVRNSRNRSNFKTNSVRNNKGDKDWSFDMALHEAI